METVDPRPLGLIGKILQFFGFSSAINKSVEVTLAVPAPRQSAPIVQRIPAKPSARWIVLGFGKLQKVDGDRIYTVNIRRSVAGMSGISVKAYTHSGDKEVLRDEEVEQVRKSVITDLQQRGLGMWLPLMQDEVVSVVTEIPKSVTLGRSSWQVLITEDDTVVYTKVLDSGEAVRIEARKGWVDKVFYQPVGGDLLELSPDRENERKLYLQLRNRIRVREELVNIRQLQDAVNN